MPLRLAKQPLDPSHIRHDGQRSVLTYHIDTKLLQKTERLYFNGYKNEQSGNVIEWLRSKGLLGTENLETQQKLLHKHMLVKEDKPNSCYHFDILCQNLDQMPVEQFVEAIRGQPVDLNCTIAADMLWNVPTRFKSVMSFREMIYEKYSVQPELLNHIKQSPIILLDPIKQIYGHKFTYQLTELSKNPNRKQEYRKEVKKKNQITSSQGRPIFSAYNIYKHYMTTE